MSKNILDKYSSNRVYVEEEMKAGNFQMDLPGLRVHEESFFLTPFASVKLGTRVADEVSKRVETQSIDLKNGKKFFKEFYVFTPEEMENILKIRE